ncbi:hypothetical protein [Arthrobacter sp.]|uniref:beta strand repeat-containing protein n=1 Tax=Arthrobacter sp. TaxID=1667 RepID=UPI0028115C2F|nr:hypothetical protein [Arthrobacter sp.]
MDTDTGTQTSVGTFDIPASTTSLNGLGIAADGSAAFGVLPTADAGRTIYRLDRATDTTTALGAGEVDTPITHGAINPDTGFYYYGGFRAGILEIYGFNTVTNTSIGLVASGTIPNAGGSGDWAFDRQGRLYVIGGGNAESVLTVIDQQLPTSPGAPITVTGTQIVSIVTTQTINGIAFGGDGMLYLGSGTNLRQVDPVTGAVISTQPFSQTGSVDLASCATPNTISVQKDFPAGRVAPTDQVTVALSGGGLPAGIDGTTAGSDPGLQDEPAEIAGPVFGRAGNTYTISESGAGSAPSGPTAYGYASSWTCINDNTGGTIASGTGTSGEFIMPDAGAAGVAIVCTFTNAAQVTGVTLDKQAGAATGNTAGSTVTYTFDVTNTGTVPLEAVTVTDPLVGTVTCPPGPLAVGATTTCTAEPYTLTQNDVNAGEVVNDATATGTVAGLPPATDEDTTTTVIEQDPSLLLDKQAGTPTDVNNSGITDAGDTIQYTFNVTNDGNLPLTDLAIADNLLSGQNPAIAVTCLETTLAPGASTICTAGQLYTVTAADEAAGEVVNTATANGVGPDNAPVASDPDSTRTVVTAQQNLLTLEKTAGEPVDVNDSGITDAGDTIQYSFRASNNGNVAVTDLVIDDGLLSGLNPPITVSCEQTTLAPGQSTECAANAVYVVTEADEANGSVDNSATAEGIDPDRDPVVSDPDVTTTEVIVPQPALSIEKTAGAPADLNSSGITDAGDTIQYTFTVTNSGNVTVHDAAVNDPLIGSVTCTSTTLIAGASTDCAADELYVVTEDDEAAGSVDNSATATGIDPDDARVDSEEDTTSTPVTVPAPALSIEKAAGAPVDVNNSGITDAGDTIQYTFAVTNTGNVPVHDVAVNDPMVGDVTCTVTPAVPAGDPITLAVGQSATCAADAVYVVTEANEVSGSVDNTATSTGTDPDGGTVTSVPDTTTTEVTLPNPSLVIEKTAGNPTDVNNSGITDAGDTIQYTFRVTNDGNVPVGSIAVVDPLVGTVLCGVTALAPTAFTDCSAETLYTITAEDETANVVANTARATGTDPDDVEVESDPDSTNTPVTEQAPVLTLEKTAGEPVDVNSNDSVDAGDTIQFTFLVTNDGNVPVREIEVNDPIAGSVTCEELQLAVGQSTDCSADELYVITQADVDAGRVVNVATGEGIDPDDEPTVSNEDSTTTAIARSAELLIEKNAELIDGDSDQLADVDEAIQYSFTVTNTGKVTITDVRVDDPKAGSVTCSETVLAPGASTTCSADERYVVTQADVDAGSIDNVATAAGTPPAGMEPVVSVPDTTSTQAHVTQDLKLEKDNALSDGDGDGVADAGEVIKYTFTATNTGTVTLNDLQIDDPRLTAAGVTVSCPATTVAPGKSVICTADYTVQAADVASGNPIENVASAKALGLGGVALSPEDATETPVTKKDAGAPLANTGGSLANTGGVAFIAAGVAGVLLLGGLALTVVSRRRKA